MTIRVSIDASGGDFGIPVTITAGIRALSALPDLYLYFVGNKAAILKQLDKLPSDNLRSRFEVVNASEVVTMSELPSVALRKKKDSSMRVAIDLVKNQKADACVSAGNTGALMAISRFVLKTIQNVSRPAIMGRIPTMLGHTHMLDLGANVDSKPATLLQFAIMGSIAIQHTENIQKPSVGLLNVGTEEIKGNEHIQKTTILLKNSPLNYSGFVEGDDIYKGCVDLVVCDGFEGNIALKASEGVATMMSHFLKQAFNKNSLTKIMALICYPVLKDFKSNLNPEEYNGASFLGLRGIVIKSHGSANANSFFQAIKQAHTQAHSKIIAKISNQLSQQLKHQQSSIKNNE